MATPWSNGFEEAFVEASFNGSKIDPPPESETPDNVLSTPSFTTDGKSLSIRYIYGKSRECILGRLARNEQMVVDYDIKNGSIISVFSDSWIRTKIHIKMLQTGKPITLDVDMRNTVLTIKRRIPNKEGISVGQQELFYLGEEPDDGRMIASYNIEGRSTIYAVFRLGDTMLISVTTEKK
ncbi:hypothetical protein IFM89_039168 [Coptis chinensis]|uniref:Ubiquitin-like domain-containing protein n=1 Tax=Coptis chinensis TaxID=261450 RepID=A0A835IHL2_9MAGN|nr:hypothetical protein IFM89_039168 [Coptis chinensis]